MDFFARQENARQHTLRLVMLFFAAVIAIIAAVDLAIMFGAWWILDVHDMGKTFHEAVAGVILMAIVIFAVKRLVSLRGGGDAVAKMVKARQVARNTTDLAEKRLVNIVDEMAIASGVAAPTVWVMDSEEGINAFAAGYSPNQAVIVVTKGALAKLDRDEMQGVIGHEFSHILNGDMRLNVRLIGILAGIVVVGEAGLLIIRLGADGDGALPVIVWGAIVAAVGYIGVLFGRMIKAAVSRQREFLADASSIQFTRNPDGLVSALRKIAAEEKRVGNTYAGEMSHMYFSSVVSAKFFEDLLATHPSVEERVASITGRSLEAPAGAKPEGGSGIVSSLLKLAGNPTPEHVDHASQLLASIPQSLRQMLETPEGARNVVYAYLFAQDAPTRAIQVRTLVDAGDGAMASGIDALIKTLRDVGPAARVPVLTLAVPTLRQMDPPARTTFLRAVDGLVDADNEVTIDEFVIRTILRRQLSPDRVARARYRDIKAVQADMVLLLATLARAGSVDASAQKAAFAKGMKRIGAAETLPAGETKLAAKEVTAALERLRLVTPMVKPDIIAACVDTALADENVTLPEMELLRVIGMAIDCPLPPALDVQ